MTYREALAQAKRSALARGRSNVFRYVVDDAPMGEPEDFVVMTDWEYQEIGNEDRCWAVVWSYEDGDYEEDGTWVSNGRLAVEVEEYAARC